MKVETNLFRMSGESKSIASRVFRSVAEFLVVGVCALAFGVTMQLFLISLINSESVGTRDFSVYWATGRQLAQHANPYDATDILPLAFLHPWVSSSCATRRGCFPSRFRSDG